MGTQFASEHCTPRAATRGERSAVAAGLAVVCNMLTPTGVQEQEHVLDAVKIELFRAPVL